ncbi:hypothetical protein ACFXAS_33690 [Streptomyces sp. NPDC059459]|uniref:hypothetical protein n=1 Tax=Streptomyces sp. NPDC059459 TaxID=3346839 RepID=UPI00369C18B5
MTDTPIVVQRLSTSGGQRVAMDSSGRDEILGTAYSDGDLVLFLEGAGVAEPQVTLNDPLRGAWRRRSRVSAPN